MNSKFANSRVAIAAFSLSTGLLLGAGAIANAHGQYDPYYGQGTNHRHDNSQHQKDEKRGEKRHQKDEKEDLKAHQRYERDQYGNDADLRYHQQQEREDLKRHKQDEKDARRSHQRNEGNGGYYGNDGYNRKRRLLR